MLLQTAIYLINCLPTPILKFSFPHEKFFNQKPNYNKLKVFDCLCFPWLKPYTSHKLEPKSSPCLFLRYFLNQSAYFCTDNKSNKIYTSHHVQFVEADFPFTKLSSNFFNFLQQLNSFFSYFFLKSIFLLLYLLPVLRPCLLQSHNHQFKISQLFYCTLCLDHL